MLTELDPSDRRALAAAANRIGRDSGCLFARTYPALTSESTLSVVVQWVNAHDVAIGVVSPGDVDHMWDEYGIEDAWLALYLCLP